MAQCKTSERWSEALQVCVPNNLSSGGVPTNGGGTNTSAVAGSKDPWLEAGDVPNILDSIGRAWNVFRGGAPTPGTVIVESPNNNQNQNNNGWVVPVVIVVGSVFVITMIVLLLRSGKKK